ncbi:autophagy-related protein 22-like protein, partial [Calycina marina]
EVFAYYLYFAGDNGIGAYQYANLLFQNLIAQAGFNPNVLPLGSAYASVILIGNGLAFLCQSVIFLTIGSLADFGGWSPWVVRIFSVLCMAFEFGLLGVTTAAKWRIAMALYIMSSVTWWVSYVFFNAVFPKLANDLPEVHKAREELLRGIITQQQFDYTCSIQRSRIVNISWAWNNIGFLVCCALSLAALFGLHADDSVANNNWGYSVALAICTSVWIVFAIPWFIWEKRRPGPAIPDKYNMVMFGLEQTFFAAKQAWKLKQTLTYLIAFFLLADGVGTSLTLISIAQTKAVAYSAIRNTYFLFVQGFSALIGVYIFYYAQVYFNLKTKTMLQISNFCCVLFPFWGTIGIWTDRVGFHNTWEFWFASALYGFAFGNQYSYGQAFMAELVPKGREFMFFSLLGIVNKGSAWIGPIACSAITDHTGNQWLGFPFVAALTFVPFVAIFLISVEKSRVECTAYLEREAIDLRHTGPQTEVTCDVPPGSPGTLEKSG